MIKWGDDQKGNQSIESSTGTEHYVLTICNKLNNVFAQYYSSYHPHCFLSFKQCYFLSGNGLGIIEKLTHTSTVNTFNISKYIGTQSAFLRENINRWLVTHSANKQTPTIYTHLHIHSSINIE